ncbi:MAG TPA: hypothetical protein DDZ51_22620, partial [Planctomycetaceae bacterium]|nr:hypothetical protein [Planctomycetaceae bacterium]
MGRAISLTHVSSPTATRVDLAIEVADGWVPQRDSAVGDSVLTRPYGYAGPTFGGISIVGEDRGMPSYRVRLASVSGPAGQAAWNGLAAVPMQFPIAPAG